MRLIAVTILLLWLQACDAINARKFEEAKAAVSEMLNDPTSAEWKDISANGPCVQGLVNAKNGFGGYVGYKQFFYNTSSSEAGIDPGDIGSAEAMLDMKERSEARIKFYEAQTRCIESSIKYMEREAAK